MGYDWFYRSRDIRCGHQKQTFIRQARFILAMTSLSACAIEFCDITLWNSFQPHGAGYEGVPIHEPRHTADVVWEGSKLNLQM